MPPHRSAFTLLEMLAVAAIITLLAIAALPGAIQRMVDAQLAGEDAVLESLRKDIVRSLDSSDFANINILAVSNAAGAVTPTNFTGNPDAAFISTSANDWFAKLAAVRGSTFTTGAPTQANQPALADILFNRFGRARLLVPGPDEGSQQRLLLISLMAPAAQLAMPASDGTAAWFNTVWNTNWDSRSATLPAAWTAALTGAQAAAWNGSSSSGTRLPRLRVVRITVPKYVLNISNTHPTSNAYIYFNADLDRIDVPAGSGTVVSGPILAGRLIRVLRGATLGTATETNRIYLRDNTDVLVQ